LSYARTIVQHSIGLDAFDDDLETFGQVLAPPFAAKSKQQRREGRLIVVCKRSNRSKSSFLAHPKPSIFNCHVSPTCGKVCADPAPQDIQSVMIANSVAGTARRICCHPISVRAHRCS
jgi:hypothetical protein